MTMPSFAGGSVPVIEGARTVTVVACETQPITAEGVRALLGANHEFEFLRAVPSLQEGLEAVRTLRPAVVLADKALGIHALLQWIVDLRTLLAPTAVAVWGISITEAEALRLVQAGAKGVIRKSAEPASLLACLRSVAAGATWMEESIFRESHRFPSWSHPELTPRERQVLELVQQGLKNTEIARELGIQPGTVKIHLRHVFEKTGIHGRHGLALSGLKDRGVFAWPESLAAKGC